MMFDEQPDGDPHGECASEIHKLSSDLTKAKNLLLAEAVRHCTRSRKVLFPFMQ